MNKQRTSVNRHHNASCGPTCTAPATISSQTRSPLPTTASAWPSGGSAGRCRALAEWWPCTPTGLWTCLSRGSKRCTPSSHHGPERKATSASRPALNTSLPPTTAPSRSRSPCRWRWPGRAPLRTTSYPMSKSSTSFPVTSSGRSVHRCTGSCGHFRSWSSKQRATASTPSSFLRSGSSSC